MKKTILSMLILSLGLTAFAQARKDDRRYDDKRYEEKRQEEKRYDDRRYEEKRYDDRRSPAPILAVQRPLPVAQKAPPKSEPIKVIAHKPAPVKFVVKKEKPKKTNPWKTFVRAVLAPPPPSRAVVIINSTSATPVYEMSQLDRQPQLVESPTINYPENMANAGISGEVTMDVQIDKNGYVGLERVVSSTNEEFAIAAISSLNSFKYEQPLKNGYPVNASFTITIPFEISE